MNDALAFLLSEALPGALHPEHRADLAKSGLTEETITLHRLRSVPPNMVAPLLGFNLPSVRSALLLPFPDPIHGFMDHVRVKVFPPLKRRDGHSIKYLQPRHSQVRLFFPLVNLDSVLKGKVPLWLCEGEKKALAVAQLGLSAVGFCGVEGWHGGGSRDLLRDFDAVRLDGRTVELAVDGDVHTNPHVRRATWLLADALRARGAHPRLIRLPEAA